jgi:hypothetical protein
MFTNTKIALAAALLAATPAWFAGSADAAPIGAPLSLQDAAGSAVQTVQWHGGVRGRGDYAAGPVAGAIIGGAVVGSRPSSGCDNSYSYDRANYAYSYDLVCSGDGHSSGAK